MDKLSSLIDEANSQLEYHRDQLLYWRRRKQELEAKIPLEYNVLDEVKELLRRLVNGDDTD